MGSPKPQTLGSKTRASRSRRARCRSRRSSSPSSASLRDVLKVQDSGCFQAQVCSQKGIRSRLKFKALPTWKTLRSTKFGVRSRSFACVIHVRKLYSPTGNSAKKKQLGRL